MLQQTAVAAADLFHGPRAPPAVSLPKTWPRTALTLSNIRPRSSPATWFAVESCSNLPPGQAVQVDGRAMSEITLSVPTAALMRLVCWPMSIVLHTKSYPAAEMNGRYAFIPLLGPLLLKRPKSLRPMPPRRRRLTATQGTKYGKVLDSLTHAHARRTKAHVHHLPAHLDTAPSPAGSGAIRSFWAVCWTVLSCVWVG